MKKVLMSMALGSLLTRFMNGMDQLKTKVQDVPSVHPNRVTFGRTRFRMPHSNGKPCYPRTIGGHNLNTDNGAQLKAHFDSKNATYDRLHAHHLHLSKMKMRKERREQERNSAEMLAV